MQLAGEDRYYEYSQLKGSLKNNFVEMRCNVDI